MFFFSPFYQQVLLLLAGYGPDAAGLAVSVLVAAVVARTLRGLSGWWLLVPSGESSLSILLEDEGQ